MATKPRAASPPNCKQNCVPANTGLEIIRKPSTRASAEFNPCFNPKSLASHRQINPTLSGCDFAAAHAPQIWLPALLALVYPGLGGAWRFNCTSKPHSCAIGLDFPRTRSVVRYSLPLALVSSAGGATCLWIRVHPKNLPQPRRSDTGRQGRRIRANCASAVCAAPTGLGICFGPVAIDRPLLWSLKADQRSKTGERTRIHQTPRFHGEFALIREIRQNHLGFHAPRARPVYRSASIQKSSPTPQGWHCEAKQQNGKGEDHAQSKLDLSGLRICRLCRSSGA